MSVGTSCVKSAHNTGQACGQTNICGVIALHGQLFGMLSLEQLLEIAESLNISRNTPLTCDQINQIVLKINQELGTNFCLVFLSTSGGDILNISNER